MFLVPNFALWIRNKLQDFLADWDQWFEFRRSLRDLWVLTLEYIIGAGWQGVSSLFVPSGLVRTLDLEFIGCASPIMRKANFYNANMMCPKSLDSWLSPGPSSTAVLGQLKLTLGVAYMCLGPINTHTRSYIPSMVDEGPCLIRFLKSIIGSLHSQWLFLADPVPNECLLVHAFPLAVPCHGWDVVFWF